MSSKNSALLVQALTHRSYSQNVNNERLEFLGDSVLGAVVSNEIYNQRPLASEGDLSRIRAALVNEKSLGQGRKEFDLGDQLILGGGELKSGGYRRDSILSDTLEAVIGAVFIDGGFNKARTFIETVFEKHFADLPDPEFLKDPKTRLQEYLQSLQIDVPQYEVTQTSGKAHDQTFSVSCRIDTLKVMTAGSGSSRKKAEQQAAEKALKQVLKN